MDWFKVWCEDKESMIGTMARNMAADLEAGYNYFGTSIQRQIREINEYREKYHEDLNKIAEMDEDKVNHWCKIQLIKSGAVSA